MRFLEVPALITEDIEDPNIVDITEPITASISGTTLTIDGGDKVSGEATITLTNDVTVSTVTTSNIKQPSIHKIIIKTNGAGNFTYVPNDDVTGSSVSTTTKTGSDLDILLITTSGGDTYLDLDIADYVSPAANFSNVLTGFNITDLTSAYGTTAKLYKPDGTLLTTVTSATTGSGVNFGYTETDPGDVIYKLEVTDDAGRKSKYNLPRKWINYAMETTSTPGFQKFALAGNEYTSTVTVPNLSSTSKARIHKTTDHGYMGIKFKIQGRNSPSDDWVDVDDTGENENADESAEFLAFGNYTYQRVWVKPTAKATTTVSSSNVVTLTLSNVTEDVTTKTITGTDPFHVDETSNIFVFEETAKIGTIPYTVTVGTETYTNAVTATTEEVGSTPNTDMTAAGPNMKHTIETSSGGQYMCQASADGRYIIHNPSNNSVIQVLKGDGESGYTNYTTFTYSQSSTGSLVGSMSYDGKYIIVAHAASNSRTYEIWKNDESTSTFTKLAQSVSRIGGHNTVYKPSFVPRSGTYDFAITGTDNNNNFDIKLYKHTTDTDTWVGQTTINDPTNRPTGDGYRGYFSCQFTRDGKYLMMGAYSTYGGYQMYTIDWDANTAVFSGANWVQNGNIGHSGTVTLDGKYVLIFHNDSNSRKIFKNNDAGDWSSATDVTTDFTFNNDDNDQGHDISFFGENSEYFVSKMNGGNVRVYSWYPKKEVTLTYNGKDMLTLAHNGGLTTTSVKLYKDDILYHTFGASETSVVIGEAGVYQAIADDKYYSLKVTVTTVTETQAELYMSHRECFLLKKDGKVWYWGEATNGGNGTGNNTTVNVATLHDNLNALPSGIKQIGRAAVDPHCRCAITNDGKLYTWGYNGHGGLGRGNTTDYTNQGPWLVSTQSSNTFTFCHSSYYSNFALQNNGYLWSCGYNGQYVLGTGNNSQQNTFYRINLPNVIDFDCNHDIAVAVTSDSEVYIWGTEGNSSMGGASGTTGTPTHLTTLDGKNIVNVRAGAYTGHAISSDGKMYSWGRNNNYQIPKGSTGNVTTPTEMTWFSRKNIKIVDIKLGHHDTAHLALDDQGNMYIWGLATNGAIGVYHHHPTTHSWPVLLKTNIASISCGYTTCGCIDKFGQVYTWGDAAQGQQNWIHGTNSDTDINYPTSNNLSVGSSVVYDGFDKYLLGKDTTVTSNVTFGSNTVSLGTKSEVFISDPHTYKFKIMDSDKTTYTSTVISSTPTRPTGRVYPPKSGTHKNVSTSGSANIDNTWTTDGALYGNGYYKASMNKNSNSSEHIYHAFSGVTGYGHMHTNSGSNTVIIQLHMPQKIKLTKYAMYSRNFTGEYNYAPKDWKVYGSNDNGTNWTELDSQTNETVSAWGSQLDHRDTKREYTVTGNTKYFSSYKLDVTANGGGNFVVISQIEYYGDEEGFLSDDGFGKLTIDVKGDSSATSNITFHSNTYVMGAARDLYITDTGEYTADIFGSNKHFLGSKTHTVSANATELIWKANEDQILYASDAAASDHFGTSVAIRGDYAISSAYNDDGEKGSAYIFYKSGGTWTQQTKLVASDAAGSDRFGWSVAIDGDYAIIGAQLDDDPTDSGSAYIFKRSGTSWTQLSKLKASDAAASDYFGYSVAISGDYAIVGTFLEDAGGTDAGAAYIFKKETIPIHTTGYNFLIENLLTGGNAGYSPRLWYSKTVNTNEHVYLWAYDGLQPSAANFSTDYGGISYKSDRTPKWQDYRLGSGASNNPISVTTDSNDVVLARNTNLDNQTFDAFRFGNTSFPDPTEFSDSVYETWSQQQKILSSDIGAGDRFGCSVSLSGDYAIVGAQGEDVGGSDAGAAYIFKKVDIFTSYTVRITRNGDTSSTGTGNFDITPSDGNVTLRNWGNNPSSGNLGAALWDNASGTSLRVYNDGTIILAGETLTTYTVGGSPATFYECGSGLGGTNFHVAITIVSRTTDPGWSQQQKIMSSDIEANDNFGNSVSLSGDYAIVGARTEDTGGSNIGAAYVYKRDGTTWSEQQKIQASDAQASDQFGYSVNISGDHAIVGAYLEDTGGTDAGAAYIFERSGTTWTEVKKITASDAQASDNFGQTVAIDGTNVIVGARGEDTKGSNAGAAYIFSKAAKAVPALNFDGYNKLSIDNVSSGSGSEWPPTDGTASSFSVSNSNRDAEWTISGASYGNGTYKSKWSATIIDAPRHSGKAFNKVYGANECFHSQGTTAGNLDLEVPEAFIMESYDMRHRFNVYTNYGQAPKDWVISGSNDGTTWTVLDTQTGQVYNPHVPAGGETLRSYTVTGNTTAYKHYRMYISSVEPSGNHIVIGELRYYAQQTAATTYTIKKDDAAFATTTSNTVYIRDTGTYTAEVKGSGAYVTELSKVVSTLATKPDYTNIWAGQRGGMVVDSEGKLYTWGDNGNNQSGRGAQDRTPTHISTISDPVSNVWVEGAPGRTRIVKTSTDKWYMWGMNHTGSASMNKIFGETAEQSTPVDVTSYFTTHFGTQGTSDTTRIVKVVMSSGACSALAADGKVWSWGVDGNNNELGKNTTNGTASTPFKNLRNPSMRTTIQHTGEWSSTGPWDGTLVSGAIYQYSITTFPKRFQIDYSTGQFTKVGSHTSYTWWKNGTQVTMPFTASEGDTIKLDDDSTQPPYDSEFTMGPLGTNTELSNITDIRSLHYGKLALDSNGDVWQWGRLRTGSTGYATKQTGLDSVNIIGIGTGFFTAYAWDAAGTIYSIGQGTESQLGNGASSDQDSTWQTVTTLQGKTIYGIYGAGYSVFAHTSDGVYACGQGADGRLGMGNNNNLNVFTKSTTLSALSIYKLDFGNGPGYIITTDGKGYALGDDTNSSIPTPLSGDKNVPTEASSLTNLSLVYQPPAITYDGKNKLTVSGTNYADTSTVTYYSNTYNLGTAKTMYVKDEGEYVFKISGTDKYVESNVHVSSVDLAGATTKPISFDGYNKLTLIDAGANAVSNVTLGATKYDMGSASTFYIKDTGTYDLEMSGSNVFALSSNVVGAGQISTPSVYSSATPTLVDPINITSGVWSSGNYEHYQTHSTYYLYALSLDDDDSDRFIKYDWVTLVWSDQDESGTYSTFGTSATDTTSTARSITNPTHIYLMAGAQLHATMVNPYYQVPNYTPSLTFDGNNKLSVTNFTSTDKLWPPSDGTWSISTDTSTLSEWTISGASYGNGSYKATSSVATNGIFRAYQAFEGTEPGNTSTWQIMATAGILSIELPESVIISKYAILNRNYNVSEDQDASPKDFTFEGSSDGSTWVTLDTVTGNGNYTAEGTASQQTFTTSNTTAYKHYRLNVTANNGDSGTVVGEFKLLVINPRTATLTDPNGSTYALGQTQDTIYIKDTGDYTLDVQNNDQKAIVAKTVGTISDFDPSSQWTKVIQMGVKHIISSDVYSSGVTGTKSNWLNGVGTYNTASDDNYVLTWDRTSVKKFLWRGRDGAWEILFSNDVLDNFTSYWSSDRHYLPVISGKGTVNLDVAGSVDVSTITHIEVFGHGHSNAVYPQMFFTNNGNHSGRVGNISWIENGNGGWSGDNVWGTNHQGFEVLVSTSDTAGHLIDAVSPSLKFDTYNKLTIANVDSDATSNIDFFSNTYEMGSRKELIINDAGTYHANIYSSNTLALVKKQVTGTVGPNTASINIAFHYDTFANSGDPYSDGSLTAAATAGHIYSDTPTGTYTWGSLDSASTANRQTTYTWTPSDTLTVDILLVGGGGGSGYSYSGGGGAGGLVFSQNESVSGQQSIVIGDGADGSTQRPYTTAGFDTSALGYTAKGGGQGGGDDQAGVSGGSGGGGSDANVSGGSSNQNSYSGKGFGSSGGSSSGNGRGGGGGGGAGGVGDNAPSGVGGIGKDYSSVFGTTYGDSGWFAGGGAPSGDSRNGYGGPFTGGTGGQGGGGDYNQNGQNHTGGGGGGNRDGGNGYKGGSGIVLIKSEASSPPSLTFDGYNKLTAPVLDASFTATRLSDWDNNNQSKSPNSGKGDWPGTSFTGESDAHWWTLHNNDKVYTSSYNYGTTRDAAQLFTTVTSSDWNHGYHTQTGWNATKILKLGYKFTVGSKTLGSMKLWQAPASYPTGDVTIKYWDGTSLKTVTNQSPSGFPSSISYYTEQEFTFNSANAQYWLIECKTHASSPSTNYIGLAGWQLLSGRDPVTTVLTKGSDSYDIGTASSIYITDTGTYDAQAKNSNTFVIKTSNVVSGTLSRKQVWNANESQILYASDAQASDEFGWSVSIDGDYAIVGARYEDTGGSQAGAVYIFKKSGTSWSQQQIIHASDAQTNDQFGHSVGISGDYAIVGAPYEDSGADNGGSAYIYKRNTSTGVWGSEQHITASNAGSADYFGWSVSISGDYAIVGANGENSARGAVYIYKRNTSTGVWGSEQLIRASDAQGVDEFGFDVSISGDYAIVGSRNEDTGGTDAGAAYIFKYDATYPPDDLPPVDSVGTGFNYKRYTSLDTSTHYVYKMWRNSANDWRTPSPASANTIKVLKTDSTDWSDNDTTDTNPTYIDTTTYSGKVSLGQSGPTENYRFSVPTFGRWSEQQKIQSSDIQAGDSFGGAVAIDGDYVTVGANYEDENGTSAGAVYIFKRGTTSLNTVGHTIPDEHTAYYGASDWICQSVSGTVGIYKHIYRTGTPVDSGLNTLQYDSSTSTWSDHGTGQPEKFTKNDTNWSNRSSTVTNVQAGDVIRGWKDNTNAQRGQFTQPASGNIDIWSQEAKLLPSDGTGGDELSYGGSIDISGDTVVVGARVADPGSISNAGAAWVFERSGTTWTEVKKITASDGQANDEFGISVAIDGTTVFVGARTEDTKGTDAGAAYVYEKVYVGPTLTYDNSNKLSLTGVTTPSSNLTVGTNTYDIGSATNVYIKDQGTYKFHTNDGDQALIMNKTVSSDPSGTTYNYTTGTAYTITTDSLFFNYEAWNYSGSGNWLNQVNTANNPGVFPSSITYNSTSPKSFVFNNSNTERINIGNVNMQQDWTLECWAKFSDFSVGRGLFGHGISSNQQGLHISVNSNGSLMKFGFHSSDLDVTYTLQTDTWYHMVFVYDRSNSHNKKTYINGVKIGDANQASYNRGTDEFSIGSQYSPGTSASPMKGDISVARMYTKCLTAEEIGVNYAAGYLGSILIQNTGNTPSQVYDNTKTITVSNIPSGTSTVGKIYKGATAYTIHATEPTSNVIIKNTGSYVSVFTTSSSAYLTNTVNVNATPTTTSDDNTIEDEAESTVVEVSKTIAFHDGTFADSDDPHGDGSITAAATAGHVYSDTAPGTYTWGTLTSCVRTAMADNNHSDEDFAYRHDNGNTPTAGFTTYKWTPPGAITNGRTLVVAGGGGGGTDMGGGGGAGGLLASTTTNIAHTEQTIQVGDGGARGYGPSNTNQHRGGNGADSSISGPGITAIGGGGGATGHNDTYDRAAGNGGSGGGGSGGLYSSGNYGAPNGTGTAGQGFDGGNSGQTWYPGGGGGAGEKGYGRNGSGGGGNTVKGNGGNGLEDDILGTNYWWAGGGGCNSYHSNHTPDNRAGHGGKGGGGGGAPHGSSHGVSHGYGDTNGITNGKDGDTATSTNAVHNGGSGGKHTGGGGGGGDHNNQTNVLLMRGGRGGSGIVVIKFTAQGSTVGIPGSTAVPDVTTTDTPSAVLDATDTTVADPILDLDFTTTLPRNLKRYNSITSSSIGARFNRTESRKKRVHKSINTDTFSIELTANNMGDSSSSTSTLPVTVVNSGAGTQYTSGWTTTGSTSSFVVPSDAPNALYYYSQNDDSAGGSISVSSASTTTHTVTVVSSSAGTQYTSGWTASGTPGSSGGINTFIAPSNAPNTLYYYCGNHSGMGGAINMVSGPVSTTFTVTVQSVSGYYGGSSNYYFIDGTQQATISLVRGKTYTFNNNASGSHPMYFATSSDGTVYDSGVTNGGTSSVTFAVPLNAPSTLYYKCGVHGGMGGTIHILGPTTSPLAVTVSGGKFVIGGVSQATLQLVRGETYVFNQENSSNGTHPLRLSTTSNGTHVVGGSGFYIGGTQRPTLSMVRGNTYTFDQTNASNGSHVFQIATASDGTQYTSGYTTGTFVVPLSAPDTLYYKSSTTAGMGGLINVTGSTTSAFVVTFSGGKFSIGGVEQASLSVIRGLTYTFNQISGHVLSLSSTSDGTRNTGVNKYYISGVETPTLTFIRGSTYTFTQETSTNTGHPIRLSTTSNGTHASGSQYTSGWTTTGTPGSSGASSQFIVPANAPNTLYYYCQHHSGMGGASSINVADSNSGIILTYGTHALVANSTVSGEYTIATNFDGTTSNLYVDGELISQTTPTIASGAKMIKIGEDYNGLIKNLKFWNYAKSFLERAFATGGTITYITGYVVHTFTSSGNFVPEKALDVEYLVVAGGGGGGGHNGGGGGAGGLLTNLGGTKMSITATSYAVVVGAGGVGGTNRQGYNGSNSSFNSIIATGGGGGGSQTSPNAAQNGGSGGGAGVNGSTPGTGISGQGYGGGTGTGSSNYTFGGGGGSGAVGGNATADSAGDGGVGTQVNIDGNNYYWAGGGGGSAESQTRNDDPGDGGLGGGGGGATRNNKHGTGGGSALNSGEDGQPNDGEGGDGGTNTGGGGGSSNGASNKSGDGGSGIVIIRYAA